MEVKQIITVTVALILVVLVAIPITDAGSASVIVTQKNTTDFYTAVSSEDTTVLSENSEGRPMINGQLLTDIIPSTASTAIIVSDKIIARSLNNSGVMSSWAYWGISNDNSVFSSMSSTINNPITCTFENGNYVLSKPTASINYSGTYTYLLIPTIDGEWGAYGPSVTKPLYTNVDTEIIVAQAASTTSCIAKGTVDNLMTAWYISNGEITDNTRISLSYDSINENGMDLYKINNNGGLNFSYIFAPVSYKTITDNGAITKTLVGLIPVLLIVALVLGVGYSIARRE